MRWREEAVLGRHREAPGRRTSRIDLTIAGMPLYRGELAAGYPPADASSAVLNGARTVGSVILAGPGRARPPRLLATACPRCRWPETASPPPPPTSCS